MEKKKLIPLIIGTVLIATLLTVMYLPFGINHGYHTDKFSNVMKDSNLADDTRVIDIAMLGAHDAFSHKINLLSKPDPAESGIVTNKVVNAFFKGGLVRVARSQTVGAKTLLSRGVRYFDVRISNVDGEWYTKHALLDTELKYYMKEIFTFLKDKPEEFIVFDIQHIFTGGKTVNDFLTYLTETHFSHNELSLESFISYSSTIPLADLEYVHVRGNNNGGIVIFLNDDGSSDANQKYLFYDRGNGEGDMKAIRSVWHNKTKINDLVPEINKEAQTVKDLGIENVFRVNQAQQTADYCSDVLNALGGWSLIGHAAKSNKVLLSNDNFNFWLSNMPIFMLDFANSKHGKFNELINNRIIAFNNELSA